MKIKRVAAIVVLAILLAGCGILSKNKGVVGKASIAEDKARAKIELVDNTAAQVNVERLDKIGAFSSGVEYSLNKDTNNSPAVQAARTLNERVLALANKPDFKEAQAIASIVDQMLTNQIAGKAALAKKDKEVQELGLTVKELNAQKEDAVKRYIALANKTAALEDQHAATLGQMDKWFGLGAVFYGLKKFVISSLWILGIGSVLFLILRIASMSNPIAASIFAIFNQIGSWFVHALSALFPKAVELAGNVSAKLFNSYKSTLTKIVDSVQMAKTTAAAAGRPATLQDVLDEAEKSMNTDEKAIVEEIKKALQWK